MLASISSFGAQDAGRAETTEAMTSLAPEARGAGRGWEFQGGRPWKTWDFEVATFGNRTSHIWNGSPHNTMASPWQAPFGSALSKMKRWCESLVDEQISGWLAGDVSRFQGPTTFILRMLVIFRNQILDISAVIRIPSWDISAVIRIPSCIRRVSFVWVLSDSA